MTLLALRRGTRSSWNPYPIYNFLSYHRLSPSIMPLSLLFLLSLFINSAGSSFSFRLIYEMTLSIYTFSQYLYFIFLGINIQITMLPSYIRSLPWRTYWWFMRLILLTLAFDPPVETGGFTASIPLLTVTSQGLQKREAIDIEMREGWRELWERQR